MHDFFIDQEGYLLDIHVYMLGANSRQETTRVVPCANSHGRVVANISRCARHLKLWLLQLNPLMPSAGQ